MESSNQKESVYSKMIRAGARTYFIDVKTSSKGDKYLTICESRKVDGEFQNSRIMVFGDNIQKLYQGLKEAAPSLKE